MEITANLDEEANPNDEFLVLEELGQSLINAILTRQSIEKITALIDAGAPLWYQEADEGISPLHAAAYVENESLVKLLIDGGAVWNAVDRFQNTAGDIALSLNNEVCYTIIRDAGIRSELLLTLLSSRSSEPPRGLILRTIDSTAAGSPNAFLSSQLRFTKNKTGQDVCLVKAGGEEVGVMMGWERGIMAETVLKLCIGHERASRGLKILNIGFGLGIIDGLFQSLPTPPSLHVIIEPHPDVQQHMKTQGWNLKKGVKILAGKWQEFIDSEELLSMGGFDVIYTDTFSEGYKDLRQFFGQLPELLAGPESRFSFFNGLGATNTLFYDVYTHLSELHLADVGVDVAWSDVDVAGGNSEDRWDNTREYFRLPQYRLPVGTMRAI